MMKKMLYDKKKTHPIHLLKIYKIILILKHLKLKNKEAGTIAVPKYYM